MKTKNFKRRTAALKCPEDIYRLYDEVVGECPACQRHQPAPERSRITGMRATEFGHLWFIDHVDITYKGYAYVVLVILDAASNLLIVQTQTDKKEHTTMEALKMAWTVWNVRPRNICADDYEDYMNYQKIIRTSDDKIYLAKNNNFMLRHHSLKTFNTDYKVVVLFST